MENTKTIVVAGGNSFIGRHLLQKLNKSRYRVISTVRNLADVEQIPSVQYIELSLSEFNKLGNLIDRCDVFIPLAWSGSKREDLDCEEKNCSSYQIIYDTVHSMVDTKGCKKIILPGSFYEYANTNRPIDESSDEMPVNAYGKYKLLLYRACREYCELKHVSCIEFRMFSVFGEDDAEEKMINSVIRSLQKQDQVTLKHGKQLYSFLHVDDAVEAYILAIEKETFLIGHYNLSSNQHMQLWEFVNQARIILKSASEIVCEDEICPAGEGIQSVMLSRKASIEFGWHPTMEFKDSVSRWPNVLANSF